MLRRLGMLMAMSFMALTAVAAPAIADYREARVSYEARPAKQRLEIALALIATGDFEAIAPRGFSQYLYRAIVNFQKREGFRPDGVLGRGELQQLQRSAEGFYEQLGNRFYTHPVTEARLLVPRKLFDAEKPTDEGVLFTRKDGMLSLIFLSFRDSDRSFDTLWRTLSSGDADKRVIYKRRFNSHFVVTGTFNQRKFYSWMARTGGSTTGFTISWGEPMDAMGRKLSVLLANAYLAEAR